MSNYDYLILVLSAGVVVGAYVDHKLHMRKLDRKFNLIHDRYWHVADMNRKINPKYMEE